MNNTNLNSSNHSQSILTNTNNMLSLKITSINVNSVVLHSKRLELIKFKVT